MKTFKVSIQLSDAQIEIMRLFQAGWYSPIAGTGMRHPTIIGRKRCSIDTLISLRDKGLVRTYREPRIFSDRYCTTDTGDAIELPPVGWRRSTN